MRERDECLLLSKVSRRTEFENALLYIRMAELSLQRAGAAEGDVENLRVYRAILQAQAEVGYFDEQEKEKN